VPSPIGHALGGFAAGWLISPAPLASASDGVAGESCFAHVMRSRRTWAFVAAGLAADLDLLVGLHSRYTHSIGAAMLVLAVALWWTRGRGRAALGLSLAVAASYASHVLLDWLANDTSPPLGIMALWPFDNGFYLSPVSVFMGISRKFWLAAAWKGNLVSVARELLILTPVAWVVGRYRRAEGH
jgi:membrane-bound metal-dependent hydrolase YbcI (DUF457 family)